MKFLKSKWLIMAIVGAIVLLISLPPIYYDFYLYSQIDVSNSNYIRPLYITGIIIGCILFLIGLRQAAKQIERSERKHIYIYFNLTFIIILQFIMICVLQYEINPHNKFHWCESLDWSDENKVKGKLLTITFKNNVFKSQRHYQSIYDGQNIFRLQRISEEPIYIEIGVDLILFSQGNDLHPKKLEFDQPDVTNSGKYKISYFTNDHGPILEIILNKTDYSIKKIIVTDTKDKNRSYVYEI